jgi:formyltetrahydrofolate synthetase
LQACPTQNKTQKKDDPELPSKASSIKRKGSILARHTNEIQETYKISHVVLVIPFVDDSDYELNTKNKAN